MALSGDSINSVLIVGPSWVGDMVMAQSLFKSLAKLHLGVKIDVVAPKWSLPILERMPEVNQGHALDVQHGETGIAKRRELGRTLQVNNYDQAIILPRSIKAALVPFFAKIPLRTGFKGEMRYGLLNDIRPFDKSVLDQTVKRFVALGQPKSADVSQLDLPQPALTVDQANADRLITSLGLTTDKPVVGFMPGAEYGPAKMWPAEHFGALAKQIYADGGQVWLFGSGKDSAVADEIIQYAGGVGENLCGKTALADVVDLIAQTKSVVSNDSGLMHVAAAVGSQIIANYGSSSPLFTPPLTDNAQINWLKIECSPCFERTCKYGHYNCLKDIKPEQVHAQLAPELGGK